MKQSQIISTVISVILIIAATAIVYSNSFSGPFLFDDYHNILGNKNMQITELSYESLRKAAVEGPSKYRWVPKASFALNFYFADKKTAGYHSNTSLDGSGFSDPDVWGYHLVNLIIHIAVALCLYFLFKITLGTKLLKNGSRYGNEVALLAVLVWALHPVQTNAVNYIVQRMTSMATLFVISSLLFYVLGRIKANGVTGKVIFFLLSLMCAVLAMFSKENGAMLPFILIGYEFYFLGGLQFSFRNKKNVIFLAVAALVIVGIGWFYVGTNPFTWFQGGYGVRDFTLSERLLTQARVITHYVSLLVLPLPSRLNLAYDFPFSTAVFAPPATLFAILAVAVLVLLIFILFKRDRLLSFGIFWFLLNLALESSIIPLEIIFEHRMYMPTAFLVLALVNSLYRLSSYKRINLKRAGILVTLVFLIIFTWQRNETWSSRENVWGDVAAKASNLTRGHMGLYVTYKAQNRNAEALEALKKAVAAGPDEFKPSFNLANYYKEKKQYKQALQVTNSMLSKDNLRKEPVYHLRASVYLKLNDYQSAIDNAMKVIAVEPETAKTLLLLGEAYFRQGNYQQAVKYYEKVRTLEPNEYPVYFNLGTVYYNLGEYDKAIASYRRALDFMPNNPDIHYNLGLLYGAKGMIKEMQEAMATSRRLKGQ